MPNTHQLHSVENANRKARFAAGGAHARVVNISSRLNEYTSEEIGQRATVIPSRKFEFKVKHRFDNPHFTPTTTEDRINILGPVLENMIPVVTSQDPMSLLAAFNKRCNFMQGGKKDEIADKEFKQAIDLIESLPDNMFDVVDDVIEGPTRERWLAKFDPAKQARMRDAWATLPDHTRRDINNKTLMVKIETLLKRDDPEWAPRAIYVGSDAHNAITGPFMMLAMERLCAILDTQNGGVKLGPADIKFGYKQNDVELMTHLEKDPHCQYYLEGDYSRNDREQRSRVAYIIDAWLAKLGFGQYIRTLMLEASEEYEVYAPLCGLKAKLKHQLPTGTTATTFRNSAFNATMFAVAMMQQNVSKAIALILGDDLLAKMPYRINQQEWVNCVDRFKMVLKAASPRSSGAATFLSRRAITTTSAPCLVPKIGKALARFNTRASNNGAITDDQYMAGKALAHAFEFRHVPQMRDLFLSRFNHHYPLTKDTSTGEIHHDSWFLKTSGLTSPEQILSALENEPVTTSEQVWSDWVADTYLEGWDDLLELCTTVILGTDYAVVDTPLFESLAIDF